MPLSTGASRRVAAAPRSTGFGSAAVDGPRRRRGREPRRPSDREKIGGAEKTSVDDAGKTRRPAARREQVPVHGAPAQRLDRGLVPAREPISPASNVAKPRNKTISPASNVANRMVQDHAPQQSRHRSRLQAETRRVAAFDWVCWAGALCCQRASHIVFFGCRFGSIGSDGARIDA